MSLKLLVLAIATAHAGTQMRVPFLGTISAFYNTNTGTSFDGRLPFPSGVTRSVNGAGSVLVAKVLPHDDATSVAWHGVPASIAITNDLIALTCDGEWGLHEAFDAVAVPAAAMAAGHGKLKLPPLPDLRCTYVVRYVRDDGHGHGQILAEARVATARAVAKEEDDDGDDALDVDIPRPRSLHISFTSNVDEMMMIWVSGGGGHLAKQPQVEWGLASGNLTHSVFGTSSTYHASDLCNAPANKSGPLSFIDPGAIHRVVVSGLPPRTRVFYRVGLGIGHHWSTEHSFMSRRAPVGAALALSPSEPIEPIKFLMYADQALPVPIFEGAWEMTSQVVRDIEAGYDAFLLHPGDLGYARGQGYIWDVWGALVEPIAARVPYMVTVGNHEYDHIGKRLEGSGAPPGGWHPSWGNLGDDSSGECGVPTAARFNGTGSARLSAADPPSNGVFWYSFEEGPVHVAVLSSEHNWTVGSRQYEWLAADLASVDRTATPWVLLATHRMLYTTQTLEVADYNVSRVFRREVEPLLRRYKVNLVLVGHQHSYERSCAAYGGECVGDGAHGTVHLTVGSAGASLEKGPFDPHLGNFSLRHVNDWGYVRLDANASRLKVQFVRTRAWQDGEGGGDVEAAVVGSSGAVGKRMPPGSVWDEVEILPWV